MRIAKEKEELQAFLTASDREKDKKLYFVKISDWIGYINYCMPEYTVHPGDIMIKFTGPEDRIVRVTDRLSDQFSEKLSDKLSDKEKLALELLVEDPGYTSPQIADKMGVSRVSVTKSLKALKERGVIERVGSDRKGYWKVNAK